MRRAAATEQEQRIEFRVHAGTEIVATWGPEVLKVTDYCSVTIGPFSIRVTTVSDCDPALVFEQLYAVVKKQGERVADDAIRAHAARSKMAKAIGQGRA